MLTQAATKQISECSETSGEAASVCFRPGNKVFMVARSRQILAIEKYLESFDKIKGKA